MDKLKIIYFSPYDLLRPRTNQISDVRFCEAFQNNACDVTLICPTVLREDNLPKNDILNYYEVKNKFDVHFLNTNYSNENLKKIHYLKISFSCFLNVFKNFRKGNIVILSRSEILLFFTIIYTKVSFSKNIKIIPWLHELKKNRFHQWIYANSNMLLATNSCIIEDYLNLAKKPIPTEVTLNPISEENLNLSNKKSSARRNIAYDQDKPLIVYTGKLFIDQKEIMYIIEAASKLPSVNFIFTGGKPDVVEHYNKIFKAKAIQNISLTGYISDYRTIKDYQKSADLLISYYTRSEHNVRYNFPNKICEYMLTGNPIITPFFEATQDLINEKNAFEVVPENTEELVKAINFALSHPTLMKTKGEQALKDVKEITYSKIAKKIIKKLNEN